MDKKYLVMGCARSGIAITNFLLELKENVILTDNKDKETLVRAFPQIEDWIEHEKVQLIFGQQPPLEILDEIEEIIMSPGIPLDIPILKKAREMKINIISEVELAYRYSKAPIIAITGTNGKTTTTTLTGEIFKNSGRKTYIVGNIGDPIINYVNIAGGDDIFIMEISSFQLQTIQNFRPHLSVVLNITEDHLDRHKTMENYITTKFRIFENAITSDFCLVNEDDPYIVNMENNNNCKIIYFSMKKRVSQGAFLQDRMITIADRESLYPVCSIDKLKIPGSHNIKNALAATALAYFGGVPISVIRNTLEQFDGVEHRLEMVSVIKGVTYINDSKGTNTDASTIAIQAIKEPIILIAGGYDKHSSFSTWIDSFNGKVKLLILLGETADKIILAAKEKKFTKYIKVDSLKEAVEKAYAFSDDGDSVLLSPACASWDMFKDFEERGRVFKEIVYTLGG